MPTKKIEDIVRPGYGIAFILVIISYALFFYSLQQSRNSNQLIERTRASIKSLEEVSAAFRDIEVGMGGYLAIGNIKFLDPYYRGLKTADSELANLDKVIDRSNPKIASQYPVVRSLCERKEQQAQNMISYYQSNGKQVTDTLKVMMAESTQIIDSLQLNILLMQQEQENALRYFESGQHTINSSTRTIAIVSFLIVAILGTYSLITFNRENLAKRQSEEAKRIYAAELEKRVEQLATSNLELERHRRIEKFVSTGRMAATMAHEIKNPLNNINLAIEQLGEFSEQLPDNNVLLEIIKRNATRINVLVTDLLNSTRYLQLNFVAVSINQLLDDALEFAKDRLQLQNVEVVKNYDTEICDVTVDKDKIEIAFVNIIINAAEAMEDKKDGRIEITTEAKENSCYIIIRDNGNGMSPDVLAKLFEPFNSTKSNGTGLGLTNAQNIIVNHKGIISVESTHTKGSTFIIQLPFNKEN